MRAGIPTQLKVFDCEPAAKRREQLSLVCALDSGHNQVRFGKISPGRLQMTAVKCTNLRDRFSLRQKLRDVRNFHLGTAGVRSEERRVGNACVSTCRFGWAAVH